MVVVVVRIAKIIGRGNWYVVTRLDASPKQEITEFPWATKKRRSGGREIR